jgi:DedD protein
VRMLRDARKLRVKSEVTLDGRKVVLLVVLQMALLGAAFAGGYFLAGGRAPVHAATRPPFLFQDPLAALDEPAPSYTFHDRLTAPRADAPAAPPSAPAPAPPPAAAPPRRPAAKIEAARPGRADLREVKALEDRVRSLVAASARESVRSQGGVALASAGSTDDELRAAMRETARPRAVVELSSGPSAAPAPPSSPRQPARPAAGRFTLQVRAFPDRDRAEELVEHLRQRGVEAYLTSAEVRGKGRWYRVRVGRFGSRDDAERFRAKLAREKKTDARVTVAR